MLAMLVSFRLLSFRTVAGGADRGFSAVTENRFTRKVVSTLAEGGNACVFPIGAAPAW
jgi:hypothetical protein